MCDGTVVDGKMQQPRPADGGLRGRKTLGASSGDGGTCCSSLELTHLCKYVETDLMLDDRFKGDVIFKELIAIHGR